MTMVKGPVKSELGEMDKLFRNIVGLSGSNSEVNSNKKGLEKKIELISNGIKGDSGIVSILRKSNKKIVRDLHVVKEEHEALMISLDKLKGLEEKLEKMDAIQTELSDLKRTNTETRLKLTPLSAKIWKFQEELFYLKKDKALIQGEHSKVMKESRRFVELRSKILPVGKLLDFKEKISVESSRFENDSKEVESTKEKLDKLVLIRDGLKQELESTLEKISATEDTIKSLNGKIKGIAPRVMLDEDEKKLAKDVNTLKEKRDVLLSEKKEISPRVAEIAEDEEKITTILDSYRAKNKRDKDKLKALKNDLKVLKIDKDAVSTLEDNVSSLEGELKVKRKEVGKLKKELSQLLDKNQEYKATIKEVEDGTKKLKSQMAKRKKK